MYLGCLCCTCGYLGMYLMVSGHAARSFPQLLLFAAAAGNMGVWFDTSALVTSVRNFPNDRGFVVGVLKSFLGLSSSIFTSIYARCVSACVCVCAFACVWWWWAWMAAREVAFAPVCHAAGQPADANLTSPLPPVLPALSRNV